MGKQAISQDVIVDNLIDPKYFIETFYWIVDKQRNKVPFIFNPPQEIYYNNRTRKDLILKARKEGFSSLIEALWLHACLFIPNSRAVILSHEMESTKRHFDRVRYFIDNMGGDKERRILIELDKDSQRELRFPKTNSSFWIGTAGSRTFGRGDDITHLHLSEVAHYSNQDVITGVQQACVPNAYMVMETTANGIGELFQRTWQDAEDLQSGSPWKQHFYAWFDDPTNRVKIPEGVALHLTSSERKLKKQYKLDDEQVYWYRLKYAEMPDKSKMPQEFPSNAKEAFIHSGRPVFNLEKIQLAKERVKHLKPLRIGDLEEDGKNINIIDGELGPLSIWNMPKNNRMYLISADVAEGVQGGDYSVAHVFDRHNWEVVARMRMHINPGEWGEKLCILGYLFNNAVLAPELNNHGWATIERIKLMGYPHLLKTNELWPSDKNPKEGFPTVSGENKSRSMIITAARNAIEDETVHCPDMITLNEMESFIQNEDTGKMEAQKNCHDDCVISFGIGVYCLQHLSLDETYADRKKAHKPLRREQSSIVRMPRERRSSTGYR